MDIRCNSRSLICYTIIASVAAIIIIAGLMSTSDYEQMFNQALVEQIKLDQEKLDQEKSASYQLIAESVMTGLCWQEDDNSKAGLFKDVNAGIAQWREHAPGTKRSADSVASASSTTARHKTIDYARLSEELDSLSFELADDTITDQTTAINGMLMIAEKQHRIVLHIDRPADSPAENSAQAAAQTGHDLLYLKAEADIDSNGFTVPVITADNVVVNLCVTMQAVRSSTLPESSSGKHLMLSNYY